MPRPSLRLLTSSTVSKRRQSSLQRPQLSGRKCLITGASRGIGRAIAGRFYEEGATCLLVGRDESTLSEVVKQLSVTPQLHLGEGRNTGKRDVSYKVGDVSERGFWEGLGEEVKDVDILVNAAGVAHSSLLLATKPALLQQIVQTNLMGTMWGCQILVKNMVKKRAGCIINVSSLLGIKGGRGSVAYSASKAGVLGLTRSLAAEVGQSNVRVNAIVPGYTETQMTEGIPPFPVIFGLAPKGLDRSIYDKIALCERKMCSRKADNLHKE
ncbi:MAG: hypothetical protein M1837_006284 [Sclerophora amabilis]|nr:MAG: hypothetical protein M1837_006284 [Sclerophora amabilis]